jgi:hypothetical protein
MPKQQFKDSAVDIMTPLGSHEKQPDNNQRQRYSFFSFLQNARPIDNIPLPPVVSSSSTDPILN